jgi:hypothetical protein
MPILSSVCCWCATIHPGFSLCPKEKGTIRVYSSFSLVFTSHDEFGEARKVLEVPVPLRVRASSLWSSPFSPQKGDAVKRGREQQDYQQQEAVPRLHKLLSSAQNRVSLLQVQCNVDSQ